MHTRIARLLLALLGLAVAPACVTTGEPPVVDLSDPGTDRGPLDGPELPPWDRGL